MLVNMTDVFTKEGQVQELSVPYETEVFTNRFGTFPIKRKELVLLKLYNKGQSKALVSGSVKLTFMLACDRCLTDVMYTFDLDFENEVVSPDYTGPDTDDKASSFMEGYHLNVDELMNHELSLNWPMKLLCREDCKGICKICGKNLNEGPCGCDDFIPDPRMAAIGDIFKANKEV